MSDTTTGEFVPTSLDDIFNPGGSTAATDQSGHSELAASVEADPGKGEPKANDKPRDEAGKFVRAEEAASPAAEDDPPHVPVAALKAERAKRQQLEREIEELRAKAPVPEPAKIPNPAEDPEGYHRAIQDVAFNERCNMSEMMAREKHPDMDEKFAIFQEAAKADPTLGARLRTQPHPWEWVYQQAVKMEAMKEIGDDPQAFRERLKAEIMAELGATTGQKPATPPAKVPTSLASARNTGDRAQPVFNGPTPLEKIVRFPG